MEIEKLVAAIERFFLDIVGSVVPGALLLVGLHAALGTVAVGSLALKLPTTSAGWAFFIALAYVTGHAITSIGEVFVGPVGARIARKLAGDGYRGPAMPEKELYAQIANRTTSREFVQLLRGDTSPRVTVPALSESELREYRSVAMTVSKAEDRATAVRFMFLSLLNLGTATALWILGLVFGGRLVVEDAGGWVLLTGWAQVGAVALSILKGLGVFLGAVVLSIPLLQRRFYFYRTSIQLPFSTAVAVLRQTQGSAKAPSPSSNAARAAGRLIVYLAGGLHTGWQNEVIAAAHEFEFLNPREHGLKDPAAYTAWDLDAIHASDLVFAYLEGTNPGGYALALEVGYAAALGKPVILVDARSAVDEATRRYFPMVREAASYTTESLEDGLRYLKTRGLLARASK